VEVVDPLDWQGPDAPYRSEQVHYIPRIVFQWKFGAVGMTVKRRQLRLRLAYAVTFNKAQGKTLRRAVVDLENPAFAHGQLYVALSRVARSTDLWVVCDIGAVERAPNEEWMSTINVGKHQLLTGAVPQNL
jgi:ATP-dependent exoDNAse (exonuclease V) alpha subunit